MQQYTAPGSNQRPAFFAWPLFLLKMLNWNIAGLQLIRPSSLELTLVNNHQSEGVHTGMVHSCLTAKLALLLPRVTQLGPPYFTSQIFPQNITLSTFSGKTQVHSQHSSGTKWIFFFKIKFFYHKNLNLKNRTMLDQKNAGNELVPDREKTNTEMDMLWKIYFGKQLRRNKTYDLKQPG